MQVTDIILRPHWLMIDGELEESLHCSDLPLPKKRGLFTLVHVEAALHRIYCCSVKPEEIKGGLHILQKGKDNMHHFV